MLQPRDQVPHFVVTDIDDASVTYRDVWQHSHLVLVCLGEDAMPDDHGSEELQTFVRDVRALAASDVVVVITHDYVLGLSAPGVTVADRWGEIVHVGSASDLQSLPSADALAEWIEYLRTQCPECEGEAR